MALLSLTYDGSRGDYLERVVPALDRLGFQATFFAYPPELILRLREWKKVAERHEIGTAFLYGAVGEDGIVPDWTPETLEQERKEADSLIESITGKKPTSFALPNIKIDGPSPQLSSLAELVQESTIRLNAEILPLVDSYDQIRIPKPGLNPAGKTDVHMVCSEIADGKNPESLAMLTKLAIEKQSWLVLVFGAFQDEEIEAETHERFLSWLATLKNEVQVGTFAKMAAIAGSPLNVRM